MLNEIKQMLCFRHKDYILRIINVNYINCALGYLLPFKAIYVKVWTKDLIIVFP